jgi:hypothetical protein
MLLKTNVAAQLARLIRIREVPVLNLSPKTG